MKQIKVYVAGKVSSNSLMGGSYWREEFCKQLEEKSGFEIVNLDPTSRKTMPLDSEMVFGRDSFFIKNSDLVIVNLTDDISVGGSQEMLIAKYFKKPLLGIARKGGKFVNSEYNDHGRIVDFVHPFIFVPCDAIVNDVDEAAAWIRNSFENTKPKGIECVDKSIEYYIKKYLDKDEFAKNNL